MMNLWILLATLSFCPGCKEKPAPQQPVGERVVHIARHYVGHREEAPNRSPQIDYWNRKLKVPLGSSYCATFASHLLDSAQADHPRVRTAVAQNFITPHSISANQIMAGQVAETGWLVIWKKGTTWQGHVEILTEPWRGKTGQTIGANTSSGTAGSQNNGDGVWERTRHIIPTAYFRITHFTPVY